MKHPRRSPCENTMNRNSPRQAGSPGTKTCCSRVQGMTRPRERAPGNWGSPELLDEGKSRKIASQPGVIAVSAFFEGFPVQSIGDADFEHVAASARISCGQGAGYRGYEDWRPGPVAPRNRPDKIIIAPCGDLSLCIFTTADAQLGLIRVMLRSIQKETAG